MSKKKKKRKAIKIYQPSQSVQENQGSYLDYGYEITSEPINNHYYKQLPGHVRDTVEQFYYDVHSQPGKTIPKLLEWIEKYPGLPMLYNYLTVAYARTGQYEKAEAVILECYQRNPDYLFARLNYAEICLAAGNYKKVADIFNHKFELKLLYPKRKKFHISEVSSFMSLIGIYFIEAGDRHTAEVYYYILKEIAPRYPLTKRLRRKLFPNPLKRLWLRLMGK